MPDTPDGLPVIPQPAALPASLIPDPLVQAARTVTARGPGTGVTSGQVLWLEDAIKGRDAAVRQATKRTMDELERVSARLVEANEALECWGAFDYLLTEAAEEMGVPRELIEAYTPMGLVAEMTSRAFEAAHEPKVLRGEPGEVR